MSARDPLIGNKAKLIQGAIDDLLLQMQENAGVAEEIRPTIDDRRLIGRLHNELSSMQSSEVSELMTEVITELDANQRKEYQEQIALLCENLPTISEALAINDDLNNQFTALKAKIVPAAEAPPLPARRKSEPAADVKMAPGESHIGSEFDLDNEEVSAEDRAAIAADMAKRVEEDAKQGEAKVDTQSPKAAWKRANPQVDVGNVVEEILTSSQKNPRESLAPVKMEESVIEGEPSPQTPAVDVEVDPSDEWQDVEIPVNFAEEDEPQASEEDDWKEVEIPRDFTKPLYKLVDDKLLEKGIDNKTRNVLFAVRDALVKMDRTGSKQFSSESITRGIEYFKDKPEYEWLVEELKEIPPAPVSENTVTPSTPAPPASIRSQIAAGFALVTNWLGKNVITPAVKFVGSYLGTTPPSETKPVSTPKENRQSLRDIEPQSNQQPSPPAMPPAREVDIQFKMDSEVEAESAPAIARTSTRAKSIPVDMSRVDAEIEGMHEHATNVAAQNHDDDEAIEMPVLGQNLFDVKGLEEHDPSAVKKVIIPPARPRAMADAAEVKVKTEFRRSIHDANQEQSQPNTPQTRPRSNANAVDHHQIEVEKALKIRFGDLISALESYHAVLEAREKKIPKKQNVALGEESKKLGARMNAVTKIIDQLSHNRERRLEKELLENCQTQFEDATKKTGTSKVIQEAKVLINIGDPQKIKQMFQTEIKKLEEKSQSESKPPRPDSA